MHILFCTMCSQTEAFRTCEKATQHFKILMDSGNLPRKWKVSCIVERKSMHSWVDLLYDDKVVKRETVWNTLKSKIPKDLYNNLG